MGLWRVFLVAPVEVVVRRDDFDGGNDSQAGLMSFRAVFSGDPGDDLDEFWNAYGLGEVGCEAGFIAVPYILFLAVAAHGDTGELRAALAQGAHRFVVFGHGHGGLQLRRIRRWHQG